MRIYVLSIFADLIRAHCGVSLLGKAIKRGIVDVRPVDIREFGLGRYRQVDDAVFGGGPGMVLRPDVASAAIDTTPADARRLLLAPWGRPLDQPFLRELAGEPVLTLLCGRYEGVDDRIVAARDFEPVSIGDYVLAGGELPALVVIEGVTRLLPGVAGNEASIEVESFEDGLLEPPCYTRPAQWEGLEVPKVLRSGDHAAIVRWRQATALQRTARWRPDLGPAAPGSAEG